MYNPLLAYVLKYSSLEITYARVNSCKFTISKLLVRKQQQPTKKKRNRNNVNTFLISAYSVPYVFLSSALLHNHC